nr:MAG TPA: hypothetical protein [Caudoviricetes sp.]
MFTNVVNKPFLLDQYLTNQHYNFNPHGPVIYRPRLAYGIAHLAKFATKKIAPATHVTRVLLHNMILFY